MKRIALRFALALSLLVFFAGSWSVLSVRQEIEAGVFSQPQSCLTARDFEYETAHPLSPERRDRALAREIQFFESGPSQSWRLRFYIASMGLKIGFTDQERAKLYSELRSKQNLCRFIKA